MAFNPVGIGSIPSPDCAAEQAEQDPRATLPPAEMNIAVRPWPRPTQVAFAGVAMALQGTWPAVQGLWPTVQNAYMRVGPPIANWVEANAVWLATGTTALATAGWTWALYQEARPVQSRLTTHLAEEAAEPDKAPPPTRSDPATTRREEKELAGRVIETIDRTRESLPGVEREVLLRPMEAYLRSRLAQAPEAKDLREQLKNELINRGRRPHEAEQTLGALERRLDGLTARDEAQARQALERVLAQVRAAESVNDYPEAERLLRDALRDAVDWINGESVLDLNKRLSSLEAYGQEYLKGGPELIRLGDEAELAIFLHTGQTEGRAQQALGRFTGALYDLRKVQDDPEQAVGILRRVVSQVRNRPSAGGPAGMEVPAGD